LGRVNASKFIQIKTSTLSSIIFASRFKFGFLKEVN
jgi:hypothetical protein